METEILKEIDLLKRANVDPLYEGELRQLYIYSGVDGLRKVVDAFVSLSNNNIQPRSFYTSEAGGHFVFKDVTFHVFLECDDPDDPDNLSYQLQLFCKGGISMYPSTIERYDSLDGAIYALKPYLV